MFKPAAVAALCSVVASTSTASAKVNLPQQYSQDMVHRNEDASVGWTESFVPLKMHKAKLASEENLRGITGESHILAPVDPPPI